MSNELAVRDTAAAIPAKIQYAKALAASGLLPKVYQQQPANILYAVEYGELLGLPAMAAITGIHVIDGRPSISAGLISALVRRAGHRLRVIGDEHQAQAQLVRSDDPGFTYKSTWTIERAKQAGLLGKTNWRQYPAAMLKARAISEVARDACQEVLLGMQYTPDELGADDDGGEVIFDGHPTLASGMLDASHMSEEAKEAAGLMPRSQRVEHEALRRSGEAPVGAVGKTSDPDPDDPWQVRESQLTEADRPASAPAGKAALEKLDGVFLRLGLIDPGDQKAVIGWLAGADWAATRAQVKNLAGVLEDFIAAADGDVEEARSQMWARYREVTGAQG